MLQYNGGMNRQTHNTVLPRQRAATAQKPNATILEAVLAQSGKRLP
jgi:hypothetical protein